MSVGITRRVDGYGRSISGYGASARNATAPNLSKTQYPVKKQIEGPSKATRSKSTSSVPTAKKALPAPERKLLGAPPPKPKEKVQNGIGTYDKAVAPFKVPSRAPTTYVPSVSTAMPKQAKPKAQPVSAAKKASSPAPFSKTTPGGKVMVSKASKPGYKAPGAATGANKAGASGTPYKGPIPVGSVVGKNDTKQSAGGYGGPLALGGLASVGGKGQSRAAPSVAGNAAKLSGNPAGGYGGPLNLGGLASKAGGSRVAPSVAGR